MLAGTRGEGSDSPGYLILDDERAYEMISRLLPQEPDLQNAA